MSDKTEAKVENSDYIVVSYDSKYLFECKCREAINKGYLPCGGISVICTPRYYNIYYQSLYKPIIVKA